MHSKSVFLNSFSYLLKLFFILSEKSDKSLIDKSGQSTYLLDKTEENFKGDYRC